MKFEISKKLQAESIEYLADHVSDDVMEYLRQRDDINTIEDFIDHQHDVTFRVATQVKAYLMLGMEKFKVIE